MASVYVVLAYFVMIAMQFTMKVPIIDTISIAGYTLRYFIFYAFIYTMPVFALFSLSSKKMALSKRFFYVFFFVVFSLIATISAPGSFSQKTAEAVLFITPMVLCCVAEDTDCSRKACIDWLLITNIAAGIVSFLVATRIIDVDIWAADGELVRTAGAINSTLGVGGFVATLVLLFVDDESDKKDKKLSRTAFEIAGFIGSILVILFSLSRTRIVIMFALCVAVFIYNLIVKGTVKGNFKLLVLLIVIAFFIFKMFPDITRLLVDAIQGRYTTVGNDENIDFRVSEMQKQLEMFKESPIIGKGWGIRSEIYVMSDKMYIHNIFTSLLMHTGIAGTVLYLCWYFSYFIELMKGYAVKKFRREVFIGILFFVTLTVLGFTNSGVTQSGGYFMIFYIALLVRDLGKEKAPPLEVNKV